MTIFKNMRIRSKLMTLFFGVGILPLLLLGWYFYTLAETALMNQTFAQLASIRQIKKSRIESYYQQQQREVRALANAVASIRNEVLDKMVMIRTTKKHAVENFFNNLITQIRIVSNDPYLSEGLMAFEQEFLKNDHHINTPDWNAVAQKYETRVRNIVKDNEWKDLLLITQNGDIIYSMERHFELGQNLKQGALHDSSLGQAFDQVKALTRSDAVVITDLAVHVDQQGSYSGFIMRPMHTGAGGLIGYVALEFSIEKINAIMSNQIGLEDDDEAVLVGRSSGVISLRNERQNNKGRVGDLYNNDYIESALKNEISVGTQLGATGQLEFVTTAPVDVPGLNWVICVTQSVELAMTKVAEGDKKDFFKKYVTDYGNHDLFLISHDGMIFYTVAKEADYKVNILTGEYHNTNLARLVNKVINTKHLDMVDFERYAPSGHAPTAFVAAPVMHFGRVEMVVALQLPLEGVQAIMGERDGMGKSGESFLVGSDKRLRSNSYDDPVTWSVVASFAGTVKNNGVDTLAVREALDGKSDVRILTTYNGHQVLSAFTPVKLGEIVWALLVEIDLSEVHAPIDALANAILMAVLILAGLVIGIAMLTAEGIIKPLNGLMGAAGKIASGEYSARVLIESGGEFRELGRIFNIMAQSNEEQFWLQSNLAKSLAVVQESKSSADLGQRLMSELVPLMGGGYGAVYVLNTRNERYELYGSYGFNSTNSLNSSFALGESLIGQCAKERRSVLMTQIPNDYIKIHSGLGASTPLQIMLVPMLFQQTVLAVIEIASFEEFTSMQHALMNALQGAVGLGFENLNRSRQTQELLEESQTQSEELASQQEDLKKSNEVLQRQAEELRASEAEMHAQQEELEVSNQTLRTQKEVLEVSQAELAASRLLIEERARDLAQASQYKSEFLANMSHELRTPLNSLLILSRMFCENREGNLVGEQVDAAKMIHASGSELLELINDILDLSKIEAGKMVLQVESINLYEFKRKLENQFAHMASDKGLAFKVELGSGVPMVIRTDGGKLGRILKNFLSNAFKFTEQGEVVVYIGKPPTDRRLAEGEVRFAAGDLNEEKVVSISVTDTGIGIAQDHLKLVFEAFQQADGGTSRQYGGTGLGLSIARELTQLLNGELRLRSQVDQGSVFTLLLPATIIGEDLDEYEAHGTNRVKKVSSLQALEAVSKKSTLMEPITGTEPGDFILDDRALIQPSDKVLLIIEDDPKFATVMCAVARKRGFKCLSAPDGESGLALALCFNPMGIILDRQLRGHLDGDELLVRLKEHPLTSRTPVHIISAQDNDLAGLMEKGAIGVLVKPVSEKQLKKVFGRIECDAGQQLLLVEDDANSSKATAAFFKDQGLDVTVAIDGEGALQLLKERAFDCMILDLDLPGFSGFDLLDQLSKDASISKAPVIIYSGRDLSREEYQRLRSYTDSVIIKGTDSGERLLNEVRLFLNGVAGDSGIDEMLGKGRENLFSGEKILLVDDDMRNIFAMSKMLQSYGLRVIMAPDGRRSLELLEKNQDVRVVLMDVMMPVMDGLEAIQKIRQHAHLNDLPIIILSAKAMPEDQEKGLTVGANAFLAKPVDSDQLIPLLQTYLTV